MQRILFTVVLAILASLGCASGGGDGGSLEVSGEWDGVREDTGGGLDTPRTPDSPRPEDTPTPPPEDTAPEIPAGPLPGGPCDDDTDCPEGPCVPTPDGFQCSVLCSSDCGVEGWECVPLTGRYHPGLCVQPDWILCRPCLDSGDCEDPWTGAGATCIDAPMGMGFCARPCQAADDCPESYTCKQAVSGGNATDGKMCTWSAGPCPCLEIHEGAVTSCKATAEAGVCTGDAVCTDGVLDCDAEMPTDETCNDEDDNCNGFTDEDLGVQVCGKGACEHEMPACQNGQKPFCNPTLGASAEICDSLDNNCNGETDELWPNLGETCDGPDPDNCELGTWQCSQENVLDLACIGDGPTGPEVCDGLDNDCDGQTDEGLGSTSCGVGACAHTVQNCQEGVPQDCDPLEGAANEDLPDPEAVDADCDGIDGEADAAIFVDGESGSDATGDGTQEAPLGTLAAAVLAALEAGLTQVYVGEGSYLEDLELAGGISLYGGYEPSLGWKRSLNYTTTVGLSTVAVSCNGQSDIEVQGFLFQSADSAGAGASVATGVLHGCMVLFSHCTFQTGDAGAGSPGTSGVDGGSGSGANPGQASCKFGGGMCQNPCPQPQGGTGGGSPCGQTGGTGGAGGEDEGWGAGGANAANGGGAGGAGGAPMGNGAGGSNGAAGQSGAHGQTPSWGGVFQVSGYLPSAGAPGTDGIHGRGGGGGGGGGGADKDWTCQVWGSGGGGGGGGGCRGTAGTAGTGGGGSFGLYAVDSTVLLESCVVYAGIAGDGGKGGDSSSGGGGGIGAGGGAAGKENEGTGGKGGNGGSGGDGGSGSGGDGGPSVGIVCLENSSVTWDGESLVSPGIAGDPGPAGAAGHPGHGGFAAASHGCE